MLNVPVLVPKVAEATALGTAWLAGLYTGYWKDLDELARLWAPEAEYKPQMKRETSDALYEKWVKAVERSRNWLERGD